MNQLASIFKINRSGLDIERALFIVILAAVSVIVFSAIDKQQYLLSAFYGLFYVGLSDLGGAFGPRLRRLSLAGVIGALVTLIAFSIAPANWVLVTVVTFILTLLAGLAVKYGTHWFVTAYLFNIWFIIALSVGNGYSVNHTQSIPWVQALAWIVGTAAWIVLALIVWLFRGRRDQAQPFIMVPADITAQQLSRPVILYSIIRALALAITIAITFGLHLPHADWMAIAVIVTMKADLRQSVLVSMQRLSGAVIGAVLATIVVLTIHNQLALLIIVVLLVVIAAAIYLVNYAWYCTAVAASVLISTDIPNPTNFTAQIDRVLYTIIGIGIGLVILYIGNLLGKRAAKAAPQPS